MRYLKISGIVLAGTLFFSAGCENLPFLAPKRKPVGPAPKPPSETMEIRGTLIATVNNMPITLEELNEQVDSFNKLADEQKRPQDKIDTRDKKIKYLKEELIRQKLLYQEALNRGLDKKESIRRSILNLKMSVVISELIKNELERVDVSSSEIEEYYNRYKSQFREPEQRQILEIRVDSEENARQVLSRYYSGEDFSNLARQYSKANSASKGGDLGFIQIPLEEKQMLRCDKFYEAAFTPALEIGGVSGIFRCPDGWYIIKLEAKKEGKQKTMNEMWDEIKTYLKFVKQQQHIDNLINKLSTQASISIDEGKIY
ncbi:MAG: peptidyl-prolyl cis-trans isomerase [Candidatus Omnitrophica bacterium]|nr:peptidyl-prolyl cis-trans isomerase [Candidatus Omnitrophota bacterium]